MTVPVIVPPGGSTKLMLAVVEGEVTVIGVPFVGLQNPPGQMMLLYSLSTSPRLLSVPA